MLVDLALRELRKRLVGLLLLTKRGLQKLNRLVEAELLRPSLERAVAGVIQCITT